ncbi:T9SS type B sorting domain-containing protein [Cellulophaga tyrosinoxydans]|uniref:Gliding motility-associated C-terminal domain-containing protein n=1 Tax=Cellulophaga tyrosinoxydans TaxID=504486 RepID=A0A1W1Z6R7_9FLAO|nr:T9SS type B sorting domain-containing protein [Cellulophaga tyrosinoxydans]SMC44002.1 gliding motility-associated C-terminal domain-containing protein [Cellulophaga tyrosinoxydans]
MNTICKILILNFFVLGLSIHSGNAQLGFCTGNSGDPIFTETFGSGTTAGPALAAGITTYTFTNGTPNDGSYTISNRTNFYNWHDSADHTPNDTNGKSLVVNADFTPGEFYRRTVTGLCENTSYEFSSWLINLLPAGSCNGGGIPINVKFQIWDATDTNLLATGDTGNIPNRTSPIWEQYGLVFQTVPGQTSVILKMINNGPGGCGNDLAIDDIVFRTCGDYIDIQDNQNRTNIEACQVNGAVSTTITASPDFSIYATHAYQWQESSDGINWTDIPGATTQNYATPPLLATSYYRVKVAEDAVNLANQLCSTVSEIFDILIIAQPSNPLSNGDVQACVNETKTVSASVPNFATINWYDAPTGGNLLSEKSLEYHPTTPGTYYAEARTLLRDCPSAGRTAVTIQFIDLPVVIDENLTFCENENALLSANVQNVSYLWNTGATTETILTTTEGIYTVTVTNSANCSSTKTIQLKQIDTPKIEEVNSNDYDIEINLANEVGNFEYSINGINYQDSGLFLNIEGGIYTIYVREKSGCGIATLLYIHFVIPKFFTPNGDGTNDRFDIGGLEFYTNFEVNIFDRYGKLLKNFSNSTVEWDGTFNNKNLPADDYWYVIQVDGTTYKGHFALKR